MNTQKRKSSLTDKKEQKKIFKPVKKMDDVETEAQAKNKALLNDLRDRRKSFAITRKKEVSNHNQNTKNYKNKKNKAGNKS